jgi:3-oxoadipate enol-lactonase
MENVIDFENTATGLTGRDVQTRKVYVNGIDIAFNLQGEGPPLVLIMGYRLNSSAWPQEFLEALARRFTLITLDNRGTGKSDKPLEGYALANLAADVCGVLDHLNIRRAHILGYSMGGAVAQEFVRQFPARVVGLVLCATMCGGPQAIYARISVFRVMRELDGLQPDEIARRIWKVTYAPNYLAQNREKAERQMRREIANPTPLHVADLQFQAFSDFDCSAALPDVRAPTLVLTGDSDELIPPGNSKIIAELVPGAELYVMRSYGHRLLWEASEECAALIGDFLEEADQERKYSGRSSPNGSCADSSSRKGSDAEFVGNLFTLNQIWWRTMGLLARWPLTVDDFVADFLIHTVQPAYFGRRLPLGDGKPIIIVPGHFGSDLILRNFDLWLKAMGYRPTITGIPINIDHRMIDSALIETVRSAAQRVGRKAVIVAFDIGTRAALRVAIMERDHVSDVIGLAPPSDVKTGTDAVRVHLIRSGKINAGDPVMVSQVKEWPWPVATNPDALLRLSCILRDIKIELLESDSQMIVF